MARVERSTVKACIVLGWLLVVAGFVMIFVGSQIETSAAKITNDSRLLTLLGCTIIFIGALVLVGVMGLIMPPDSGMDKPSIDDFGGVP